LRPRLAAGLPYVLQLSPGVSATRFGRRTPDGHPFYLLQLVDQLERLQLERLQLERAGSTVSLKPSAGCSDGAMLQLERLQLDRSRSEALLQLDRLQLDRV
jgi:hypothetical protein